MRRVIPYYLEANKTSEETFDGICRKRLVGRGPWLDTVIYLHISEIFMTCALLYCSKDN